VLIGLSRPAPQPLRGTKVPRSGKWPAVQAAHIKAHPYCAACGAKDDAHTGLNVHHILPYHLYPEHELDPLNLVTLCEPKGDKWSRFCHLALGHRGDFKSFEPDIVKIAHDQFRRIQSRPYGRLAQHGG
jgi:5-methylcytosine-specific restriction protein A